jgi:hypothetical protein
MIDRTSKVMAMLKARFLFYAPRVLKVQTMRGKIIPLELNKPQQILHSIVEDIRRQGRLVRIVALKARRMGFSTYFSGRYYHKVSWNHNRYAVQITHEPEATDALFKMVKRFHDFTPPEIKPQTKYNNARLLEFNTKDGRGLNSGFRVATAGKEDFGSGQLIHYLHLSEAAKWPAENTESLLTSLLQAVPDDMETEVCFESTAKGIGGEFYDRFWNARYRVWISKQDENGNPVIVETMNTTADVNNVYTSIFLPWFVFDENRLTPPADFELTPDEVREKKQYGLFDDQIYWRRFTIANKCNSSIDIFNQEHPATPELAFLGTGRPVFDNAKLLRLKEAVPNPIARYEVVPGTSSWMAKADGRLSVWEEPIYGRNYIVTSDIAEGLRGGDFTVADVVDHQTGKQVAHWHGKIDPDAWASVLIAIGKRYNVALLAPERNNHGLTTITFIVAEGYPNLYVEMVPDPPGKPRKRYGWVTSNATRPLILDNLIREVREDTHTILNRDTFDEMMSFKIQDNGRYEADAGRHDDRVICIAIAKHLRQVIPLPAMKLNQHHKKAKGMNSSKPDRRGWT